MNLKVQVCSHYIVNGTEKWGNILPIFKNYYLIQQNCSHHWQMNQVQTHLFIVSLSSYSLIQRKILTNIQVEIIVISCKLLLSTGMRIKQKSIFSHHLHSFDSVLFFCILINTLIKYEALLLSCFLSLYLFFILSEWFLQLIFLLLNF